MSYQGAILSTSRTAAIMNSFVAMPLSGSVGVPAALAGGTGLNGVMLTDQNAAALVQSVDSMTAESRHLEALHDAWALPQNTALLGTTNDWSISAFPVREFQSFDDIDIGESPEGLILHGPHNRRVRLNLLKEGLEVSLGLNGSIGKAIQTVFIDSAHRVWTSSYHLDFMGQAVQGLRHYLQIDGDAPLAAVAVSLVEQIVASQQFAGVSLGEMTPGPAENPSSVALSSEACVITNGRREHPEPAIEITGEEGANGFLTLTMRWDVRRPTAKSEQRLVPLSPAGFKLWRGASLWALHEPTLQEQVQAIVGDQIHSQVIEQVDRVAREMHRSMHKELAVDIREIAEQIIQRALAPNVGKTES